jgi:hypothetical protein
MLLWSDDSGDSTGASLESQEGVMEGVVQSFPAPRMVLQHSTVDTGESPLFFLSPSDCYRMMKMMRSMTDDSSRCSQLCCPQTSCERI